MRNCCVGGRMIWIALYLAMPARSGLCRAEDDLTRLRRQTREFEWASLKAGGDGGQQARRWASQMREDGSWADIDYADQARDFWKTEIHLKRTLAMAAEYARDAAKGAPDSKGAAVAGLKAATLESAHYWISHDFKNPNWWQNEIGVPKDLVTAMLLVEDGMSAEEKAGGLAIVGRATISMTGQNRVWKSGIVFRRALVQGDMALAGQAREAILDELKVTPGEGLQVDDSFHQHGPQQQMGNYGLSYAADMVEWGWIWRGTALAMPEEKTALLRDFLLRGEAVMTVNGAMDISGCGRQLIPHVPTDKGGTVLGLLGVMAQVDPGHAADYAVARSQDTKPVGSGLATAAGGEMNKDFFRSDTMVQRRPGFYASVRLCSNRVIGEELVNAENVSGRYLADGGTFLYQTSKEYTDIFPVWDWRRVPGVTCLTTGTTLAPVGKMATDFAGGVSDGTYGAAGLDYLRDGVSGKKGWFFFDEGVVCMGAGIMGAGVRTSVDQRLDEGGIVTSAGGAGEGVQLCHGVTWVLNGAEGYVFPQPRDVWAGTQLQTGTWKNVYASGPAGQVAKEVFSIWLDDAADGGTYAYTMLPGMTAGKLQGYVANPRLEILTNTPEVQAVRDDSADVIEAVFYNAGQLQAGNLSVQADGACAVLMHGGATYVADPTQKEKTVTLTINGKAAAAALPQGEMAGSSVRVGGGDGVSPGGF